MILTDREIKVALARRTLVIDPRPDDGAFASTSVDLTLDKTFSEFRQGSAGVDISINPTLPGFDPNAVMEQVTERRSIDTTAS